MSSPLSPVQFGSLHGGEHIHLPGHEGTMTVSRNDNRAGKSRLSYTMGDDPQEYSYIAPSAETVELHP